MDAPAGTSLVAACEAAEIAAVESWTTAMPAPLSVSLRGGCERMDGALLVHAAAADVLMMNRVIGLGVAEPARESQLDAALARFASLDAKRCMVQLAPGARPAAIEAWLRARGFYLHNLWIRLVRDVSDAPEADTDLRVATLPHAYASEFGRMEAEAFGHPPELAAWNAAIVGRDGWHFYGAFDRDVLAAAAGMYVRGEVAWLGFAATQPRYRGHGAQSALIVRRMADARALGCRWLAVETSADSPAKPNPSTRNLRRLGFRDAYERPNWVKLLGEPAA